MPESIPPEASDTDPWWVEAHEMLLQLHKDKSRYYGNDDDRLANFTLVATATGKHPALYPTLRIIEKAQRVVEMIEAEEYTEIEEFMDIAGLALCAEVLNMRQEEDDRIAMVRDRARDSGGNTN